jgi:hypothetical protein
MWWSSAVVFNRTVAHGTRCKVQGKPELAACSLLPVS